MMTIEQIEKALQDRYVSAVADGCGLSRQKVSAIKNGRAKRPTYETIRKLSEYLETSHQEAQGHE